MNWHRFAWLVILLLTVTIVWGAIDLKGKYERISSAKSGSMDDPARELMFCQRRIADHRKYIETLEKVALWSSQADPLLWVTQQADGLDVSIIGVERLPAKYVSVYSYMPINITVRGDYNPLGRFINNLERSPNMVRIDSFRIKRKEHTPEQVVMELSLSYLQRAEGS